jgi:5-methylcytosine-specific restriction protein A
MKAHNPRVLSTAGYVNISTLPKGPHGRALCRWCSNEVPVGRRTFCSEYCVGEHKIRSDPSYARRLVWRRDRGVCAECGLNTDKVQRELQTAEFKKELLMERGWSKESAAKSLWRRTLWDMDHAVPVVEGGGCCGLDGLRTLCIPCHQYETAQLAARRAAARKNDGVTDGAIDKEAT